MRVQAMLDRYISWIKNRPKYAVFSQLYLQYIRSVSFQYIESIWHLISIYTPDISSPIRQKKQAVCVIDENIKQVSSESAYLQQIHSLQQNRCKNDKNRHTSCFSMSAQRKIPHLLVIFLHLGLLIIKFKTTCPHL